VVGLGPVDCDHDEHVSDPAADGRSCCRSSPSPIEAALGRGSRRPGLSRSVSSDDIIQGGSFGSDNSGGRALVRGLGWPSGEDSDGPSGEDSDGPSGEDSDGRRGVGPALPPVPRAGRHNASGPEEREGEGGREGGRGKGGVRGVGTCAIHSITAALSALKRERGERENGMDPLL
jgi:hypothetical protein